MIGHKIKDASYNVYDSGLDLAYTRSNMGVHQAKQSGSREELQYKFSTT